MKFTSIVAIFLASSATLAVPIERQARGIQFHARGTPLSSVTSPLKLLVPVDTITSMLDKLPIVGNIMGPLVRGIVGDSSTPGVLVAAPSGNINQLSSFTAGRNVLVDLDNFEELAEAAALADVQGGSDTPAFSVLQAATSATPSAALATDAPASSGEVPTSVALTNTSLPMPTASFNGTVANNTITNTTLPTISSAPSSV